MSESRAYTAEEARAKLLDYFRATAKYWAELPDLPAQERCDGLAFSLLNLFDGTTIPLPALNITLAPHPEDQAYRQAQGEKWFEPGQLINDCYLHEHYYRD